jgi:peptide deformylase
MIKNNGCGIAAPQVGINKRFFVAIINNKEIKIFINPKIIEYSKETNLDTEGCLSIPNMEGVIERYNWIKIKYFNGKKIVTELYTGLNARIIQHENDHLDGILYTDKMVKEKAI